MKVSVLMPTYNHELFIAQAIESFLAQNCNFQIELLIGDDASTDNTLSIAEKYRLINPEKIKLISNKTNQGLLENYKSLINIAKGEYFAILESDDYWTDNLKLQKQVNFLDSHPTYGISYTMHERLRDDNFQLGGDNSEMLSKDSNELYERFLLRNIIKSPTVCFRRNVYEEYCNIEDYIRLGFKTFDLPVWLSIIRHSKLHYLNTPTAVYRSLKTSISNNKDLNKKLDFEYNVAKIRRYVISMYGSGKLSMYQIEARETIVNSRHAFRCHKFLTSLSIFVKGFGNICLNYLRKKQQNV